MSTHSTLSNFNGIYFEITVPSGIPDAPYVLPQRPKWVDRNAVTMKANIRISISGIVSYQERKQRWKPVTLEFKRSNLPACLVSQDILDSFITAKQAGGKHQLQIESLERQLDGTYKSTLKFKSVLFDWRQGDPVRYDEVTPTDEADPVTGRLYELSVFFLELL